MSVSSIIDPATGKIFDNLVPQGGGVPLAKGQLLSADALGVEHAVPTGVPGTILSANPAADYGLSWIAVPGATPLAQGQLLSADLAGTATIVQAPNLPAQANYVLTADGSLGAAGTNMLWKPATGAGGIISANAPLVDDAGVGTNTISIDFTAAGQIPYGTGAKVGALTNAPVAGQILGINAGVPTWIDAGGSGTIVGIAPIVEVAGPGNESQIAIGFQGGGPAAAGQIPYGTGVANTGALSNVPTSGTQFLGVVGGVPAWKDVGASGAITAMPAAPSEDGMTDVVVQVNAYRQISDETTSTQIPVCVGLTVPTEGFIPYADLTQEIVEGWLNAGTDVPALDAELAIQLDNVSPVKNLALITILAETLSPGLVKVSDKNIHLSEASVE